MDKHFTMDSQQFVIRILCFISIVLGRVHGTCDTEAAQQCHNDLQATLQAAASDLQQIPVICQSDSPLISTLRSCTEGATSSCDQATQEQMASVVAQSDTVLRQTCAQFTPGGEGADPAHVCFLTLSTQCMTQAEGLENLSGLLAAQNSTKADQAETCSKLEGVNYGDVKECVAEHDCADVNIISGDIPDDPNIPQITFIHFVEFIEGLCQPGCENFQTSYKSAQNCMGGGKNSNPTCSEVEDQFECMRVQVGRCGVIRDFMNRILESKNVRTTIAQNCPDLNLSLDPDAIQDNQDGGDKENSANNLRTLLTIVLPLTLATLMHL